MPPRMNTTHPWFSATEKAVAAVALLTLDEKRTLVTGFGWETARCVGNIRPITRIGFKGLCLQDGPLGVRYAEGVTVFPAGINVAASFDTSLMMRYGVVIGREFRDLGAHVHLGPMMNLMRAPAGGRNWEGPGGDPFLAAVSASSIVKGIQSQGVIATAKHFIGNEQEIFRQSSSSNIDDRTLREVYLAPFEACVREGVGAIMCSYNRVNNEYACSNSALVNDILKGPDIDFRGFVMTDWWASYDLNVADMIMVCAVRTLMCINQSIQPGTPPPWNPLYLSDKSGSSYKDPSREAISESRLNDMAVRILAAYYHINKNDTEFPETTIDSWFSRPKNVTNYEYRFKEHARAAREMAAASTVLVKNRNGEEGLPIQVPQADSGARPFKIAVLGEDARRAQILNEFADQEKPDGTLGQGWGSGTADFPYLVSPLEGIISRVAETRNIVVTSSTDNQNLDDIIKVAGDADVAIVFAFSASGEGYVTVEGHRGDRNDLNLWHEGDKVIEAVASANKRTIVVLHTVGAVEMPWLDHPNIVAVVYALLPGQESGNAITDVLFGDVNPSARLPFTIFKHKTDYAADILYESNEHPPQITYHEGALFDYRHADAHNVTPLFWFGHGLSYTTFSYSNLMIDVERDLKIKLMVTNLGSRDGFEVVQVYLSYPPEAGEPPKLLKGFTKVRVEAGKSAEAHVTVWRRDLRCWIDGAWRVFLGDYKVQVGASSGDARLETTVVLSEIF
ncbi:glycoside hydrolase superfamily [Chytriomyces sp. MP71]|nr:glycoside hydrolase superfamily [Chytriomyces sp. MP71]